jgi:hypothetical protein
MNRWKQQMGGRRYVAVNVVTFVVGHSGHMLFVMYAEVTAQTDKLYLGQRKNKS